MADLILSQNSPATMSSLEMVDFINSQRGETDAPLTHANFLAKVNKVLGETSHSFECDLPDGYGRPRKGYNFPKREACLMAMSYSYDLQAKVFDRMTELESRQIQTKPKSRLELAKENVLLIEEIEAKDALLLAQAPAVEYVERFVKAEGLFGVREAAKSLGLNQNAFVNMLIGAKVMFRENGHLQAYAPDIDAGRFVVKTELDSTGKARASTKFTSKGLRWVAGKLRLNQLFQD